MERPAEIYGSGSRIGQHVGEPSHVGEEGTARLAAVIAKAGDETHRRGNTNQGSTANLQLLDGISDGLRAFEIARDFGFGQGTLIDDAHRTGGRP